MLWTRAARLLIAKIAMLALLLGSVAPLLSQVMQPGASGAMTEICSASGSKWVDAGASTVPVPVSSHLLQHCLSCGLHASAQMALPPSVSVVLPAPAATRGQSWPQPAPLGSRDVWAVAQPRAPPQAA